MLKKSASGVLAALRGSTYRKVRLASSLAAALLNGIFEHLAVRSDYHNAQRRPILLRQDFYQSFTRRILFSLRSQM